MGKRPRTVVIEVQTMVVALATEMRFAQAVAHLEPLTAGVLSPITV